jgi:Zn-dependent M28 family amino/carboxypeptidase
VRALADEIGARHVGAPDALRHAQRLIETRFRDTGWDVDLQPFEAGGVTVANVEARVRDSSSPFFVVGAHYDTVPGTPGANDNGTGVAALMELAGILREAGTFHHVRLVAFVNEEPPWFQTAQMGSTVYAARARAQGDRVTGMLSDLLSAPLLRRFMRAFRAASPLPLVGAPAASHLPGVGWSDHWSFWRHGFRALMLTDTAPFRYPHYHQPTDTPDRIDYVRLAFAVEGIAGAVAALADDA